MNRLIKFRAWDTDEKYMYQVKDNNLSLYPKYRYTVQQFTGLKDKNGKECYEGDIVKIGDDLIEEVKWIDEKNWMADKCPVNGFVNHESVYKIKPEVIGNIFENPELIK